MAREIHFGVQYGPTKVQYPACLFHPAQAQVQGTTSIFHTRITCPFCIPLSKRGA